MKKQMPKNQMTRDMQRSVADRLAERYGKFIPAPFTYRVGPDGSVQRVGAGA